MRERVKDVEQVGGGEKKKNTLRMEEREKKHNE